MRSGKYKNWVLAFGVLVLWLGFSGAASIQGLIAKPPYNNVELVKELKSVPGSTADHSKFDALKKTFKTGPDVTKACLSCHTEAAKQVMATLHWTWFCPESAGVYHGKSFFINNFCISVMSNEPRCTSCHAGYGWKDKNFDFKNPNNVDCLVCHDNTKTYKKFPPGAGHPVYKETVFMGKKWVPPDLSYVAQHVGKTSRYTCGRCHFYGGGGDNVKHGDLSSDLINPDKNLDVHMDAKGLNFTCTKCHTTKAHKIAGRCYEKPAPIEHRLALPKETPSMLGCENCHGTRPHKDKKLNDHTDRVACQTCHIPYFARGRKTNIYWDWSTAGKFDKNGNKIHEHDEEGYPTYKTEKGTLVWARNVVPVYAWYNGKFKYNRVGAVIDSCRIKVEMGDSTVEAICINRPLGSPDDPDSRIYPFKVHFARQPYDPVNKILVIPKLFGPKGSGAFWAEYDWNKAISKGMEYVGLKWSGKYGFIKTVQYFTISHQVAPKEQALKCYDCHRQNGRLAYIQGVYMPGRDRIKIIDILGWLAVFGTLVGVVIHGGIRLFSRKGE